MRKWSDFSDSNEEEEEEIFTEKEQHQPIIALNLKTKISLISQEEYKKKYYNSRKLFNLKLEGNNLQIGFIYCNLLYTCYNELYSLKYNLNTSKITYFKNKEVEEDQSYLNSTFSSILYRGNNHFILGGRDYFDIYTIFPFQRISRIKAKRWANLIFGSTIEINEKTKYLLGDNFGLYLYDKLSLNLEKILKDEIHENPFYNQGSLFLFFSLFNNDEGLFLIEESKGELIFQLFDIGDGENIKKIHNFKTADTGIINYCFYSRAIIKGIFDLCLNGIDFQNDNWMITFENRMRKLIKSFENNKNKWDYQKGIFCLKDNLIFTIKDKNLLIIQIIDDEAYEEINMNIILEKKIIENHDDKVWDIRTIDGTERQFSIMKNNILEVFEFKFI